MDTYDQLMSAAVDPAWTTNPWKLSAMFGSGGLIRPAPDRPHSVLVVDPMPREPESKPGRDVTCLRTSYFRVSHIELFGFSSSGSANS